jgi:hypothetical protein
VTLTAELKMREVHIKEEKLAKSIPDAFQDKIGTAG